MGKKEKEKTDLTERTGRRMMDILELVGKESGTDEDVYMAVEAVTARKIISMARYLFATGEENLEGLEIWAFTHILPYKGNLTDKVCRAVCERIAGDPDLAERFFSGRSMSLEEEGRTVFAVEFPPQDPEWRDEITGPGWVWTAFSADASVPVSYGVQYGNLPRASEITMYLPSYGEGVGEIITPWGFESPRELDRMLQSGWHFLVPQSTDSKDLQKLLDAHMEELSSVASLSPEDPGMHAIRLKFSHVLPGKEESRDLFLYLYYCPEDQEAYRMRFDDDLLELKSLIESGYTEEDLNDQGREKVRKYLVISGKGKRASVSFNKEACLEACRYAGNFVLLSDRERDPFEALELADRLNTIHWFFRPERHSEWSYFALQGRTFVRFVALCYYSYYRDQIRKISKTLGIADGDPLHDIHLGDERKLKKWLGETPSNVQLGWFDPLKNPGSVPVDILSRDRIFLERLGLKV